MMPDRRVSIRSFRARDDRRRAVQEAPSEDAPGGVDFAQLLSDGLRDTMGIPVERGEDPSGLADLAPPAEPQPRPRRT